MPRPSPHLYDRSDTKMSFAKKVGICLSLIGFGTAMLFMMASIGPSTSDLLMRDLKARGKKAEAKLTGSYPHSDGPQGAHEHVTYTYKVGDKAYAYEEAYYPEKPGQSAPETVTITYVPETPARSARILWEPQDPVKGPNSPAIGIIGLGVVLLAITLARAKTNRAKEIEEAQNLAKIESQPVGSSELQVFHYRQAVSLIVGIILIVMCSILIGSFGWAVLANESISVNGRPTPGREVWYALLFVVVCCTPFLVISVFGLMSYFKEKIVWGDGQLVWYDRRGQLRVRTPLSNIRAVRRTPLYVNGVVRITIDTLEGEVRFLHTAPWAETLELLAAKAAEENGGASIG